MPKIAQILVAAGIGARAGGDIPKQYRMLGGKTVLERTVAATLSGGVIGETMVVIAAGDTQAAEILNAFDVRFTTGGASRTESVKAGLEALSDNPPDYVLIHDAARPFVSTDLIARLVNALESHDAAVPVLPLADAVKAFNGNKSDESIGDDINRAGLRAVQTPQAFDYAKIKAAFDTLPDGAALADDIAAAKSAGLSIAAIDGDAANYKLTYQSDFERAKRDIMSTEVNNTAYTAVGTGYDVHRYAHRNIENDILWLCGVPIECGYTLLGHSDADAGLHALTDALLGAICFGDIGDHFPPSDPKWKGASSDKFLEFARDAILERGGKIQHVDITLICEKPKIKPHREAMRARVAELLALPLTRVSVKATTTEKLGFTGRGEGLAAQAAATVSLPE